MVQGKLLLSRAVLRGKAPGLYDLCKVEGPEAKPDWELYYAASAKSRPAQIRDNRFHEALQALLEWHEANCTDCIELAHGQWNRCAEGQDLFARI